MPLPTVVDVYEARRRLGTRLPRTPLLCSSWLSSIADGNVFLKIESLNLTNSFKIRGALNAALRLSEGIDSDTTTRCGLGRNHGRSMATACRGARPGMRDLHAGDRTRSQAERDSPARRILHSDSTDYDAANGGPRNSRQKAG